MIKDIIPDRNKQNNMTNISNNNTSNNNTNNNNFNNQQQQ